MGVRAFCYVLVAGLTAIGAACAQPGLQDENFITPLPHGFKIGLSKSRPGLATQEFVPSSETVQDWSEMVTVQILLGQKSRAAGPFLEHMSVNWARACPNFSHGPMINGLVTATRARCCS